MFSICCLYFISKTLGNASKGQAERDLCMIWGILFVVSQICTWNLYAYDLFYLGSMEPFFDLWPEDYHEEYVEDIVKEELRKADNTHQRLEQLEQVRENGLVNDSEYQQKKEEIVLQIGVAQSCPILTKIWDDHDEELQKYWKERRKEEEECCP